ncbi:uncharacterized protein PGTG_15130 [Puccinia graminis f. sp. tritici CRL 75-36-700-3]|uniref:Uncharacterized protein n=1 Tax=Puccinia graminis f. sp. tritici (strain CRL 75-36-700-3 / race SCCL) TaxID=418459 RepID=E3KXG9_PUCGT|nr:uncharacterized protein PGTG_15130 [Puccinia graminis f. sp. tritici CRL 75-36-700-3]EFP88927.1 hypothetical protein PGTG_15130 [Puccinia graminis f. sp. tritici CRL 75-36-700-3]
MAPVRPAAIRSQPPATLQITLIKHLESHKLQPPITSNRPPRRCMCIALKKIKKLFQAMGNIKKLLTPRSSPQKARAQPADENRLSPGKPKSSSPTKLSNKLRKLTNEASLKTHSSVDSLASSGIMVSSQETFVCDPRPVQGGSNPSMELVPQETSPPVPVHSAVSMGTSRAVSGLRKKSPPRKPITRSPIETRSWTAAHRQEALKLAVGPDATASNNASGIRGTSRSGAPLPLAAIPEESSAPAQITAPATGTHKRRSSALVIYPDSFPGLKDAQQQWNVSDSFSVPASVFASPPPSPSQPAARIDSPPKKRRLLSRRNNQRADWFSDPARPKLETIAEANSSDGETQSQELSPPRSSIPFPASPFQQSFPQNARQTTPPAQSASTQTSQHVDQHQSDMQKVVIKLTPDGKPDPKYILSQLFRMMQEDAAAAVALKAKNAEEDFMSGFSTPESDPSLPASPSQKSFIDHGEKTTPPAQITPTRPAANVSQNQLGKAKAEANSAQDAKRLLSERLKMMQEDAPAAPQGVEAVDDDFMDDFSSPLSSSPFPALRPKQFLTGLGEQTTPPALSKPTRSKEKAPDAQRVLSERLKMMEEDSPSASQGVQAVDDDFMSGFSSPRSSPTIPASRPKQFLPHRAPPAQSTSTQTSQPGDLNQSDKREASVKLGPHGKPDPKYILSQLFKMMEEDAAATRRAKAAEGDFMSGFSTPESDASL